MINKIFAAAILTATLSAGMTVTAFAGEGGGNGGRGGGGRDDYAFASMTNPDGSSVTARGTRNGGRVVTHRDRNGKVTKVTRTPPRAPRPPRGPAPRPRGTSWAYGHSTGILSVGLGNGAHLVVGPFGIGIAR